MPEQVRLWVGAPPVGSLSWPVREPTGSAAAPRIGRSLGLARYHDFNVSTHNKRIEKLRSLHRNPVACGLVALPEEAQILIPGMTTCSGYLYHAVGNRMAKGTITSMTCDPPGNGFQFTQNYAPGLGADELNMLDGKNNWQRTNIYVGGKLIGTYDLVNNPANSSQQIPWLHFHLEDPLGSKREQVSFSGGVENRWTSLPFGNDINNPPTYSTPDATEHHFTGKERDSESGNDYFGARYYASTMGRFMSPDWSAKVVPVPYAKLDNPQSLNLYAYVGNNPLAHFDADGHIDCTGKNAAGPGCQAILKWNLDHGIAPDAKKSNAPGEIAVMPNGNKITDPHSPTGLMMSPTRDLTDVAAAGKSVKEKVDKLRSEGKNKEAAALLMASLGPAVGTGGSFDYQRMGPQSDVITGGFQQLPQFRDVSNFNVGLFSQQAGMTLEQTLSVAGDFAHLFSGNFSPNSPYGLDPRTADFITGGFNEGASGAFNPQ